MFLARFQCLASGTSLFSFSLFMGQVLKFHVVRNRTFRIDSKTFSIGFPRDCFPLWETNASESCETQPNCGTTFTEATAFSVVDFSSFWRTVAFRCLFIWLFTDLVMDLHPVSVLWN